MTSCETQLADQLTGGPGTWPADSDDDWLADGLGRWWVLRVRSRAEKVVAEAMKRMDYRTYLPLARVTRHYRARRVEVTLPLFPGYLFVNGDAQTCDMAWRTRRVVQILPVADQACLREELRHVRRAVESDQVIAVYPALRAGRRCRVTSGALAGLEGVVLRHGQRTRLYLAVTILGQSVVVEIDGGQLEPLD